MSRQRLITTIKPTLKVTSRVRSALTAFGLGRGDWCAQGSKEDGGGAGTGIFYASNVARTTDATLADNGDGM